VTSNPLGKVINPSKYDAVFANNARLLVPAQLLVPINVPVNEPLNEPVFIWVELDTTPDGNIVGANDADIATLLLCAQLLVPNNEPLNPSVAETDPVTIVEPVTTNEPVTSNPFGKLINPSN
jgi:hypothetical protein